MKNISIENLRKNSDLELIAEQYADYYNHSVLGENWTKESATALFNYFYKQTPDLLFVAYDNNKPIGIIMSTLKPWWDGMHLEDGEVFVVKEYQHGGSKGLI